MSRPSRAGGGGLLATLGIWRDLGTVARRIIVLRAFRSIAQGALMVDFVLYLDALHWSAPTIGALLMAEGLASAGLIVVLGRLSDRIGRKLPLLVYESSMALGTMVLAATTSVVALAVVSIPLGVGLAVGGSAGPFGAVEQAWLADASPDGRRGQTFSLNSGLAFTGLAIGSLAAGAVGWVTPWLPGPREFDAVFALVAAISIANAIGVLMLKDRGEVRRPEAPAAHEVEIAVQDAATTRRENRALLELVMVNATLGLGIGLLAPLLPYWFALKFGEGPSSIGVVYSISFVLAGLSAIFVGDLSSRFGLVRTLVGTRLMGVALLAAIPFAPTFGWAAALYVARTVASRGSNGVQQAFGVELVRGHRRGLASGLNAVSMRLLTSLGPAASGVLYGLGSLALPFWLAAGFQLVYVLLFKRVLGRYEVPAEDGGIPAAADPAGARGEA